MFKAELTPPLVAISACLFANSLFAALPDGYQRLEYIQFNGAQYISVPQTFSTAGMGAQVKVRVDSRSAAWGPHVVNTDKEGAFWIVIRHNDSTTGIMFKTGGSEKSFTAEQCYPNGTGLGIDTTVDVNSGGDNKVFVNGKELGAVAFGSTVGATGNFCIGNYYGQRTNTPASLYGRYYYCKLYSSGTLMVDLVPCVRTSDKAVGFYDAMSKSPDAFYGAANAGGKALTAGPEASEIDESLLIESTPYAYPVVSPACGTVQVKAGGSLELSAPLAWTNDTGDCRAELAGWTLYESENGVNFTEQTNGTESVYTYVNAPAKARKFEWRWRYYYRYTAKAHAPLRLDAAEKWVEIGTAGGFSVTNVPRGCSVKWEAYAGTVNGKTVGSDVSLVSKEPSFFRAVAYEEPIALDDFYLTTSWQPIATGFKSVSDVVILEGKFNGKSVTTKDSTVYTYGIDTKDGEKDVQFIVSDGGYHLSLIHI